eukprot:UN01501
MLYEPGFFICYTMYDLAQKKEQFISTAQNCIRLFINSIHVSQLYNRSKRIFSFLIRGGIT